MNLKFLKSQHIDMLRTLWFIVATIIFLGLNWRVWALLAKVDSHTLKAILSTCVGIFMILGYNYFYKFFQQWETDAPLFPIKDAIKKYFSGAVFGFSMLSIVVFLMWMFGGYTIMDINYSYIHVIGLMFISFFAQATIEELTFRGLFFRKLENWFGTIFSLIVSSILFWLAHWWNPGATMFDVMKIWIEWGLLLAATYLFTKRNIWFTIWVHALWNAGQGNIYWLNVSGIEPLYSLFSITTQWPAWISGWTLGAEWSIMSLIVVLTIAIILLRIVYKRGEFKKFRTPWWNQHNTNLNDLNAK